MLHQRPAPAFAVDSAVPLAHTSGERRRAVLWLTALFWATHIALFTLANWLEGHPRLIAMAGMRLLLAALGFLLCLGILLVLRRLAHRALRVRGLALLLLAPLAAETYAWASYFGYGFVNDRALDASINWASAITVVTTWTWFFVAWAGLCMALEYHFDAQDEKLRAAEFQALAERAKQQALHNQVNPHFLFNSLNSISALINERRIECADRMIEQLATYFRKMLAVDPSADIPLDEEIGLQLEYLAIEKARYPDLAVDIDLEPGVEAARVPALLLQPLVENAVKHGVARSEPPAKIVLRGRRSGEWLQVAVENHGKARRRSSVAGAGVGLVNVRERLANRFGDRQDLRLESLGDGGFSATIRLPLMVPA